MSVHEGWSKMNHEDDHDQEGHIIITERMDVPGGWLYRIADYDDNKLIFATICFVPHAPA